MSPRYPFCTLWTLTFAMRWVTKRRTMSTSPHGTSKISPLVRASMLNRWRAWWSRAFLMAAIQSLHFVTSISLKGHASSADSKKKVQCGFSTTSFKCGYVPVLITCYSLSRSVETYTHVQRKVSIRSEHILMQSTIYWSLMQLTPPMLRQHQWQASL